MFAPGTPRAVPNPQQVPYAYRSCIPVKVYLSDYAGRAMEHAEEVNVFEHLVTLVKRPATPASFQSVAEFARDLLMHVAPHWIIKLVRRYPSMHKRTKGTFVLSFGGGYELLVLLEGAEIPRDLTKVPRASVVLSVVPETEFQHSGNVMPLGITSHRDGIWDHVDSLVAFNGEGTHVAIVLGNKPASYAAPESHKDRVACIAIWTQVKQIFELTRIEHPHMVDLLHNHGTGMNQLTEELSVAQETDLPKGGGAQLEKVTAASVVARAEGQGSDQQNEAAVTTTKPPPRTTLPAHPPVNTVTVTKETPTAAKPVAATKTTGAATTITTAATTATPKKRKPRAQPAAKKPVSSSDGPPSTAAKVTKEPNSTSQTSDNGEKGSTQKVHSEKAPAPTETKETIKAKTIANTTKRQRPKTTTKKASSDVEKDDVASPTKKSKK